MATWDQPSGNYWREAMDELNFEAADLEQVDRAHERNVPVGVYPNLDAVYARAWELERAEQ